MPDPAEPLSKAEEEATLWTRFVDTREGNVRAALLDLHLPFARILAAKLYARRQIQEIEFDEYHQLGIVGMLESLDRYDPTRGVPFRSFAALRIEGAILNGIERYNERQEQISLKTRLKRQRMESVKSAPREGGADLFAQLADVALGMALSYMLEDSGMVADPEAERADNAYSALELKQLKQTIADLVKHLPDQERNVIKAHYFWGMGVEEIGAMLGVTKGRISQVHRQALGNLLKLYRERSRLDVRL
jgi:RNA polymerase sigma factor for flagellar operon FliA